jgi:Uma2 family endonuclease
MSDMAGPTALSVRIRPIAVDEYHRMGAVGILRFDERVELLNGRIVEMAPIGPRHTYALTALHTRLVTMLGDRAVVFSQGPVRLDGFSEPQPDVAVTRGPLERYSDRHPTPADTLLVVEVSDATLRYDRGEKRKAYATAGIPEYWIVDIRHGRIEVYAEPDGDRYRSHTIVARGQRLAARAFPSDSVDANEVLGAV